MRGALIFTAGEDYARVASSITCGAGEGTVSFFAWW